MKRNSQLSFTLHALLHMGETARPWTSEQLAQMTGGHAVVVRRTMAGLRAAKIVKSDKGHGGGWQLMRPLSQITLGEVYDALGAPALFALADRSESPGCLVEQAVNRAMHSAFGEAEALLLSQLHSVTLEQVAADVRARHPLGAAVIHHPGRDAAPHPKDPHD